ncbi:MAG TPA: hypothetical protein VF760_03060, partial [Xanthobacteraceae bacterium]
MAVTLFYFGKISLSVLRANLRIYYHCVWVKTSWEIAIKHFVTALLFVVATSVSAFAQGLPIPCGWLNQRGSIMKLYAITPSGAFTGVYFNNAAGFQCRYGPNNPVPYTVNGHASG